MSFTAKAGRAGSKVLSIILGGLFVLFALWVTGVISFDPQHGHPRNSAVATSSSVSTYSSVSHHYSFSSSQPLCLLTSGPLKTGAHGFGTSWQATYVPKSELSNGDTQCALCIQVQTMPGIKVAATGKYGASYFSQTRLELDLLALHKSDPTAVWSKPTAVEVDGAKGWGADEQQDVSGVPMRSLVVYTVRDSLAYRIEFTAKATDLNKWADLGAQIMESFRLSAL
jgi:hypothetical protein